MTKLATIQKAKELRRTLRKRMPKAEAVMWIHLRNRQFENVKFRRQYSVGMYVVDFYAAEYKLVVELDGNSHYGSEKIRNRDAVRDLFMQTLGMTIVRYTNEDVNHNLSGLLDHLKEVIQQLRVVWNKERTSP